MGAWIQCRVPGFVLGLCSVSWSCFFTNRAILQGDMTAHLGMDHIMTPHGPLASIEFPCVRHRTACPDTQTGVRCTLPSARLRSHRKIPFCAASHGDDGARLGPASGGRPPLHRACWCPMLTCPGLGGGAWESWSGPWSCPGRSGTGVVACALYSAVCMAQLSYRVCL